MLIVVAVGGMAVSSVAVGAVAVTGQAVAVTVVVNVSRLRVSLAFVDAMMISI